MSMSSNQKPEHPSTYFVQDRSNVEEMERLRVQDRLATASMGGVLPEQTEPQRFQRVLDVGCGTGSWLIEVAKTYPTISHLVGVDISKPMLAYAQAQAEAEQVGQRVEFQTMDALRMLEFPSEFFDLVNLRFGVTWMRTWDWSKLLQEFQRVLRPDGIARLTEAEPIVDSSSPALLRLNDFSARVFAQAGHLFAPESDGLTSQVARLLTQQSFQNVQTRQHIITYRAGTDEGRRLAEDMKLFFHVILPFWRKWMQIPDDYEELYHRMLSETQQPDFVATGRMLTAWGQTPPKE